MAEWHAKTWGTLIDDDAATVSVRKPSEFKKKPLYNVTISCARAAKLARVFLNLKDESALARKVLKLQLLAAKY